MGKVVTSEVLVGGDFNGHNGSDMVVSWRFWGWANK